MAKREMSRISQKRSEQQPVCFPRESIEEQTQLLKATIRLMQLLDSHPTVAQFSQPTLRHTDLHMGNIYVVPEETSRIASLIGFQSASVLPAFLQAQCGWYFSNPRRIT